jgi:hypothetical protein
MRHLRSFARHDGAKSTSGPQHCSQSAAEGSGEVEMSSEMVRGPRDGAPCAAHFGYQIRDAIRATTPAHGSFGYLTFAMAFRDGTIPLPA